MTAAVTTRRMRQVARIWSIVIIGITLVMTIAHIVVPEPAALDYPPVAGSCEQRPPQLEPDRQTSHQHVDQ